MSKRGSFTMAKACWRSALRALMHVKRVGVAPEAKE